jgi:DNA (cytosine-5)-methyltransferase 1
MIYCSVCSGIEAATVAWRPLGWRPAWFAEVDPFCSALLKHHYPDVRNYGDFTKIGDDTGPSDKEVGRVPEAKPTETQRNAQARILARCL